VLNAPSTAAKAVMLSRGFTVPGLERPHLQLGMENAGLPVSVLPGGRPHPPVASSVGGAF
jgi:hypothetical protein